MNARNASDALTPHHSVCALLAERQLMWWFAANRADGTDAGIGREDAAATDDKVPADRPSSALAEKMHVTLHRSWCPTTKRIVMPEQPCRCWSPASDTPAWLNAVVSDPICLMSRLDRRIGNVALH